MYSCYLHTYSIPGEFISKHMIKANLNVENIHVIGHSMGAQVAAYLGKFVHRELVNRKLARISALDPAGPGYQEYSYGHDDKLQKSDATFVDVTHSDSNIFGTTDVVGHVDYFPMGGQRDQPGCQSTTDIDGSGKFVFLFLMFLAVVFC